MTTFPKESKNKNSISLSRGTLFRWYCIWVVKHATFLIYSSSQVCPNVLYGCTAADGYFLLPVWLLLPLLMVAPPADGCSQCWWLLPLLMIDPTTDGCYLVDGFSHWWLIPLLIVYPNADGFSHCSWLLPLLIVYPTADGFSHCWWLLPLLMVSYTAHGCSYYW